MLHGRDHFKPLFFSRSPPISQVVPIISQSLKIMGQLEISPTIWGLQKKRPIWYFGIEQNLTAKNGIYPIVIQAGNRKPQEASKKPYFLTGKSSTLLVNCVSLPECTNSGSELRPKRWCSRLKLRRKFGESWMDTGFLTFHGYSWAYIWVRKNSWSQTAWKPPLKILVFMLTCPMGVVLFAPLCW